MLLVVSVAVAEFLSYYSYFVEIVDIVVVVVVVVDNLFVVDNFVVVDNVVVVVVADDDFDVTVCFMVGQKSFSRQTYSLSF